MTKKKAEYLTGYELKLLEMTPAGVLWGAFDGERRVAFGRGRDERSALRRLVHAVYVLHCREVLALYGYRCAGCRRRRPLQFHHRQPRSLGGTHRRDNLEPRCWDCHRIAHATRRLRP